MVPKDYDVKKDPAYIIWKTRQAGRRGREPQDNRPAMQRWTQFLGMTLSELVELRKQHLASQDEQTRNWEESKIEEFMAYLSSLTNVPRSRKGKMARGTVVHHVAVIHSFYSYHKLDLTDKAPPTWVETEYHPCTIEDVREVYKLCDVRARFVLNALVSTGLSNEDLAVMKLGNGTPSILEQAKIRERVIIRLSRAKTKVRFRSILGATCVDDLRNYLQYRQGKGEQLTADSFLITGELGGITDYRDVYRLIRTPAQQAGKEWLTPKLLRKVFNQIVKNQGMDDHAEYWMGHKMAPERRAYFENMPDSELLKAYQKVEPLLNVKTEGLVLADEKRLKLDWQLDMLKQSMPELYTEFNRMKTVLGAQGRALSMDEALSWISAELMKRQPTGGLAWTQLSKKDRLLKVLAMLADVMSEEGT